jgi:mono/diheme cytochrome c family protein
MLARFNRRGFLPCTLGLAIIAGATIGLLSRVVHAQSGRTANDGVYTDAQATRGRALYQGQCAQCHGDALGGGLAPPLSGSVFIAAWGAQPLWELASKIRNTMPASDPGKLTPSQSADLVAYLLQVGKFISGRTELGGDEAALKAVLLPGPRPEAIAPAGSHAPAFPAAGNLAQVMRGILFPTANIIFNVQTYDPGAPAKPGPVGAGTTAPFSWTDWGAGIYKGWEVVDYAAVAVAESAPLMLTPGRRCENGRPVPVDRPDWIKFTQELAEAGRAAYKASQTRSQEAVSDSSNQLSDACLHCHQVYRDKPGGKGGDPSNKAAHCLP